MSDSYSEAVYSQFHAEHRRFQSLAPRPSSVQSGFVFGWIIWFAASVLIASALLRPTAALAAGQEAINRDQDIVLQVDSRWPGNAYGGYFPLRIKLSNMGPPRALTLEYAGLQSGRDHACPKVLRTVRVEQQATTHFTLSIPMVSAGTQGVVRVYAENGAELKGLSSRHALPDFGGAMPRAALLIISTDNLDDKTLQSFEDAAATESANLSGTAGGATHPGSAGRYGANQIVERDHVLVQPAQNLPVNWIDYSGVDLVAVDWQDWSSRLTIAERDAILKWTSAGGVLLIYGTGQAATQHAALNQSLQLDREAAAKWSACLPDTHHLTKILTATAIRTGGIPGATTAATSTLTESSGWKISEQTYSHRDWILGQVHVFPNNPFPGNASDWAWWLSSLPRQLSHWPQKFGMSSRSGNPEFLTFLIPGVGSVPVYAFLCLITAFTLIIGPLNYYFLFMRRRLALMVLTVPAIAGITCLVLFAYSLIADGFSIRSRIHSFTWLDQQRKSAISLSRLSLYAPFAPSAGLKFSPECAVFPIWPATADFEGGSVNWSANDQRLSSAWFRSQTWTQFQTIENRAERGRLDYTPPTDPKSQTLAVSNGLSWDLDYLAVKVTDTQWYAGGPVQAGATAELKRVKQTEVAGRFNNASAQTAWTLPAGVTPDISAVSPFGMRGGYFYGHQNPETVFANGLLVKCSAAVLKSEPQLQRDYYDWRDGKNIGRVQPHSAGLKPHYWAICRGNPGVQTGVKSATDTLSLHLLFGSF